MSSMPDAVILCGGAGLRLRSVTGDTPKAMASIAGRPFLEILLNQLKRYGFSRIILSVGHQSHVIRDYFGEESYGLELLYSFESSPRGTGGALREASNLMTTDSALVMNGDSYTDLDLSRLSFVHLKDRSDLTVVVVAQTRSDAGSVLLDDNGRVTTFAEKQVVGSSRYLSAGIYMLNKNLACSIPNAVQISLEEQLFPLWIREGRMIRAFVHPGESIDIGTPERFRKAQDVLAKVEVERSALRCDGQS